MIRQYYQRVDPEGVCLLHLTKRTLEQSNMIDECGALAFGEINGKEVHPSRSFRAAVTRHGRRISCVFVKGRWVSPILHGSDASTKNKRAPKGVFCFWLRPSSVILHCLFPDKVMLKSLSVR